MPKHWISAYVPVFCIHKATQLSWILVLILKALISLRSQNNHLLSLPGETASALNLTFQVTQPPDLLLLVCVLAATFWHQTEEMCQCYCLHYAVQCSGPIQVPAPLHCTMLHSTVLSIVRILLCLELLCFMEEAGIQNVSYTSASLPIPRSWLLATLQPYSHYPLRHYFFLRNKQIFWFYSPPLCYKN